MTTRKSLIERFIEQELVPAAYLHRGMKLLKGDAYRQRTGKMFVQAFIALEYKVDLKDQANSRFPGVGVYALFIKPGVVTGRVELDMIPAGVPVYVGVATPNKQAPILKGYNMGRRRIDECKSTSLYRRVRIHWQSICDAQGLDPDWFEVALVTLDGFDSTKLEKFFIDWFRPVWNESGFGNKNQGVTRRRQAKAAWDSVYPGRSGRSQGKRDRDAVLLAWTQHLHYQFYADLENEIKPLLDAQRGKQ